MKKVRGALAKPMPRLRGWLVPRIVFPLYERLSGSRVWSEALELRELQWRSTQELEARALRRLRALLLHAGTHVPYYQERFLQAGFKPDQIQTLSDLRRLPIITKSDLRANFPDGVVAKDIPPRRRQRMLTGGSSGAPLEFFLDRASRDSWLGTALVFLDWAGVDVSDTRVSITSTAHSLDSSPTSLSSRISAGVRRAVLGEERVNLVGNELSVDQLLTELRRLSGKKPYFIRGYASYLAHLASQLIEDNLELPAYPKVVMTHADNLTELNAATIERAFRCPVVNQYSAWEVPQMAQTCPDNPALLHVNNQRAILRVAREDGSNAAVGEEGRILVTDLSNYVMPFINYDIGDWALVGPSCACGRGWPTLQGLHGRTSEVVRSANGRILTTATLGHFILRKLYQGGPYIWEYQAVQTAPDQVVMRVVPTARFNSEYAAALKAHLESFLGDVRVQVEVVQRLPLEASGKRLVIKSELSRQ